MAADILQLSLGGPQYCLHFTLSQAQASRPGVDACVFLHVDTERKQLVKVLATLSVDYFE